MTAESGLDISKDFWQKVYGCYCQTITKLLLLFGIHFNDNVIPDIGVTKLVHFNRIISLEPDSPLLWYPSIIISSLLPDFLQRELIQNKTRYNYLPAIMRMMGWIMWGLCSAIVAWHETLSIWIEIWSEVNTVYSPSTFCLCWLIGKEARKLWRLQRL